MKKKLIVFFLMTAVLCTFTGCTAAKETDEPGEETSSVSEEVTTEDSEEETGYIFESEKIVTVLIEDPFPGEYEDDFSEELTQEELSIFLRMVPNLEYREGNTGQGHKFRLVCLDGDGAVVEEFMVDSSYNLNHGDQFNLYHDDESAWFLKNLADSHGYNWDYLKGRFPGSAFLDNLSKVSTINFNEITENNFIEGAEYTLGNVDAESVKLGLADAVFTGGYEDDFTPIYVISMFDKYGSELYRVNVTPDKKVFFNNYPVEYDSVKEWLNQLETISGFSWEGKETT